MGELCESRAGYNISNGEAAANEKTFTKRLL